MRKTFFALLGLLTLVTVLIIQFASFASANWISAPAIEIQAPLPYWETIYQNGTIDLKIEARTIANASQITRISYNIDGQDNQTLIDIKKSDETHFSSGTGFTYTAQVTLINIANGNHTLCAYSRNSEGGEMSIAVTFAVDTTFRYPTISIISPLNQSYSTNEIPLTYTIDAKVKWSYYTIDSFGDKTFSGNITLTDLPEGPHTIRVSALTEMDYYAQRTAYFNVETPHTDKPLTLNSQINSTAIGIIAMVIAMFLVVVIYKRKKRRIR